MDRLSQMRKIFSPSHQNSEQLIARKLRSLCPSCYSIVKTNISGRWSPGWNKQRESKQNPTQLRQSASTGCHLCILQWADISKVGPIPESRKTSISNVTFIASGVWDPHDRREREQARYRRDLLISHQDLDYGRSMEITSESELVDTEHFGESENLMNTFDTPNRAFFGCLTIRTQYQIQPDSVSWDTARSWLMTGEDRIQNSTWPKVTASFFPTRLIYLGTGSSLQPVLCEGRDLPKELRYMTLSQHQENCNIFKLTTANLPDMKQSITTSQLSRTHLAAMLIAKQLEVCYIWIDSLCTIQDSSEDLAREATLARDVYGHTWGNIAARGSGIESYEILGGMRNDSNLDMRSLIVEIKPRHSASGADGEELCKNDSKEHDLRLSQWDVNGIFLAPRILWEDGEML